MKKNHSRKYKPVAGVQSKTDNRVSDDYNATTTIYSKPSAEKNAFKQYYEVGAKLGQERFRKGMTEKEVRLELFLLEGIENFEKLSLRSKMTGVIERSDKGAKELYFDLGVNDNLPKEWNEFKQLIIEYCTDQNLESIRKYKDERWTDFFMRIQEWSKNRNIKTEEIFKYLRRQFLPAQLQMLVYGAEISLNTLIERTKEFEKFITCKDQSRKKKAQKTEKSYTNHNSRIKCYGCNKRGHIKTDCPDKKVLKIKTCTNNFVGLDRRSIFIYKKKFEAIFDTGASDSFICTGVLASIENYKLVECKETFQLIDGSKIVATRKIALPVTYDDKTYKVEFYVINNEKSKDIIIGNKQIINFTKSKKMPIECEINTGSAPYVSWTRPIRSYRDRKEFEILLEELEKNEVIEESKSKWLNPVVLTRKANGKLRFCIDFRRLNDLVSHDEFAIPKISELISQLRDMRYYSLIDLKDGFFHVEIKKEHREKTTFFTGTRLMQFRKMPQGYKNSPAIFQRAMTMILKDLLEKACIVYIDDILIFGRDKNEHDQNLKAVKERLEQYGLSENLEKRKYCQDEIVFLGYVIGHNSIRPTTERSQGITDFKEPKTKKQLQRFIGLVNYDRIFVKNITKLLSPLYDLLKGENKFKWTILEQQSFEKVKEEWRKRLENIIPDINGDFILETDASGDGIGGVLVQEGKPVGYISRKLSMAEQNYSITEREVLAALWAMEKFEYLLCGKTFKLKTDHKAIEEIKKKAEFGSARIRRWFERLERFSFVTEYVEGESLIAADALSRSVNKIVNLQSENILKLHEKMNHRKDLKAVLKENNIEISKNELKKILDTCMVCNRLDCKIGQTCYFIMVSKPGELVGVDILEMSKKEKIVILIDYFSRKIYARQLDSKEAKKVCNFLQDVHANFQFKKILSDNGREFQNETIKNWCTEKKIEHVYSIPYYHKSNGRIERANRTIRNALSKTKGLMKVKLQQVIDNYNNMKHRGIGMSPNEAMRPENHDKVKLHELKYKQEFDTRHKSFEKLEAGDVVIIKNEHRTHKKENRYENEGIILKRLHGDTYSIKDNNAIEMVRHITQLKRIKRGGSWINGN